MNNKDKLFLASLQGTLKEFVCADIGRAAKADLLALEKASGGKKKLDEADKALADAKKEYGRLVGSGKAEADRLIRFANDSIAGELDALKKKATEHADMKAALDAQKRVNEMNLRQFDDAMNALSNRQRDADKDENVLVSRELEVAAREMAAAKREAEIKRFDDWRNSAPA